MIVTKEMLDSDEFAPLFMNRKNTKSAKDEILKLFGEEPGNGYAYSEQDIYEQM